MRGQADHLARPDQARVEQPRADAAVVEQSGAGSRGALLRRLEKLAPSHPSSVRAGDRREPAAQPDPDGQAADADTDADTVADARPAAAGAGADADSRGGRAHGGGTEGADRRTTGAGADARPPAADGQPPAPDSPGGSFWDKREHFQALWQDHLKRWPDKPAKADRSRPDDPPGSWRGDGSRCLSPEDNAEANKIISLLRAPEEATTEQLRQIQDDNPHGGYLAGLEHRIKGEDRLKEKIVDELESVIGTSVADAASRISDAVRYTFCFGSEEYVSGHDDVQRRLESAGYRMTYSKNHWLDDPEYKGINTRWQTPEGARFELQFHIPESFDAKEHLTHKSYDRLRSTETSWEELPELELYQRTVSAAIPQPDRVAMVPDQKERF